jgi:SM-20-related protein
VKHVDAPDGKNGRRVTCIFYGNFDWKPEHGGELKIFLPTGEAKIIEPRANRLVLFQSQYFPHEVLSSYAQRLAVTMWFH